MVFFITTAIVEIAFILITGSAAQSCFNVYPDFTAAEHPLNTLPTVSDSPPLTPVVMQKYYFCGSADYAMFIPGALSYNHYPSEEPFLTNADFLTVQYNGNMDPETAENHGKVHLHYPARVFLILYAFNLLNGPKADFKPTVTGIPDSWTVLGVMKSPSSEEMYFGDPERWGSGPGQHFLYPFALAVEIPLPHDNIVTLPHPRSIYIDGHYVRHYAVAFTDTNMATISPPKLPSPFHSPLTNEIVRPLFDPPIPNTACPQWLHDVYVVQNRNMTEAKLTGEPAYWRTWHPMIDPIYWCYFDHEHGSYPGPSYKPPFGYTAYKTIDTFGDSQDESHEGFKIYSIPQLDNRLVVMTVHIHLAKARRFTTRKHTIIFTVLSSPGGTVELELFSKADFGPGLMFMINGLIPIDDEQKAIKNDIFKLNRVGERIFNVLNIDQDFPESVNKSFRYKGNINSGAGAISNGLYEQWKGALPSCSGPNKYQYGAFIFDIRDPSSAMRTQSSTHADEDMQELNGQAVKRIIMIRGNDIQISVRYCKEGVEKRELSGAFYTDTYFDNVGGNAGRSMVRQFVKQGFRDVVLKPGLFRAGDPWSGWYGYDARPGLEHIERATLKSKN